MKKKIFILIIVVIGIFFAVKHFFMKGGPPHGHGQMPPPIVSLVKIQKKKITETNEYIARVQPKDEADIIPRIDGYIQKKYCSNGAFVNKGDLLYLIDPDRYQAAVAKAKAAVENAKVALWESEKNMERAKELVGKDYISKSEYDNKLALRDKNRAALEAAKAELIKARDDLKYTKIRAPFPGKLGGTTDEGNYASPVKGPITNIVRLDPIFVTYNIPAEEFTKSRLKLSKNKKNIEKLRVKVELPDGTEYPIEGKQYTYNNKVNETTGTIEILALFRNPEGILLPGTLVNAVVYKQDSAEKTVVPQAAVLEDPRGKYVYYVDEEGKAQQKRIKISEESGKDFIVESGLEPGEEIIMAGIQKIMMPGMQVTVGTSGEKPPVPPSGQKQQSTPKKPAKGEKADVQ